MKDSRFFAIFSAANLAQIEAIVLSFATEFPVDPKHTTEDFIDAIKEWILDSPHTVFRMEDLFVMKSDGKYEFSKGHQRVIGLNIKERTDSISAIAHSTVDKGIEWRLESVHNTNEYDAWVSIRIFRESSIPLEEPPVGKKPVVVGKILQTLGGGQDSDFLVQNQPHRLNDNDIHKATSIVLGTSNNYLPIVYISCNFYGGHDVDLGSLSNDLSGMAHVVAEPNREFSRRLQIEVKSENVYGGSIGIYWPNAAGRKSTFNLKNYRTILDLKKDIVISVRFALLSRHPFYDCTWHYAQERHSALIIKQLKSSGSERVDEYIAAFDQEKHSANEKLKNANQEISRLKNEIVRYERSADSGSRIHLNFSKEQEHEPGEFLELIMSILLSAEKNVHQNSRKHHLIVDILSSNDPSNSIANKNTKLKEILRDYSSMNAKTRGHLQEIGFSIHEDGKHYKMIYKGDERYTFTLSKTGGDHRGGLNMYSDIAKILF